MNEDFALRFYRIQALKALERWKKDLVHAEHRRALYSGKPRAWTMCASVLSFLQEQAEMLRQAQ